MTVRDKNVNSLFIKRIIVFYIVEVREHGTIKLWKETFAAFVNH